MIGWTEGRLGSLPQKADFRNCSKAAFLRIYPKACLMACFLGWVKMAFPGWFKGLLGWQSRPLSLSGD